jgi:acetylornithine/succinyldiaminopimelate/putrescine aminotransferase
MSVLTNNPALGHITTFGGHPLCCAAGMAAFKVLLRDKLSESVKEKEYLFRKYLKHPAIIEMRGEGLILAVELGSAEIMHRVINKAVENGIITDWFIFCETSFRISPSLTISGEEIKKASDLLLLSIEQAMH